eukprot:CFRG2823T1
MGKKIQGDNGAPLTLLQLQNLIKRDPESYQEEFLQQLRHFDSSVEIFQLNPAADSNNFGELATFLAHTCTRYPKHSMHIRKRTMDLLENYASVMQPALRREMCHAVMMMKGKDDSGTIDVFKLFFKLFKVKDKVLRETLRNHIITEIKRMNAKSQKNQMNKALQGMMFQFVNDDDATAAHMSVMVMVELYRKGAWADRKTVNVMATACLSPHMKVVVASLQFFLGIDNVIIEDREDELAEKNAPDLAVAQMAQRVGKKTKSKARQVERVRKEVAKENKRSGDSNINVNFSALHLINDPQGLAEKLFNNLKKCSERYEVRLMMINLISRLIGVHELTILNFYPFILKFFQPKQPDVTKILAYAAQGCHEMVPPDAIEQMVTAIANNFVTERCSSEVMTVGLNSIRGICARSPLAMNSVLMSDLAEYKSYKDKSVMMAARSLIGLFRVINPDVLPKKDRGFEASVEGYTAVNYGENRVTDHVAGAEVLGEKVEGDDASEPDEDEEDGWESDSSFENGDIEGEWVKIDPNDDSITPTDKKNPLTKEELESARHAAKATSVSRVFTEEDFKKIKRARMEDIMNGTHKRKRGPDTNVGSSDRRHDNIVDVSEIEKLSKRQKMDKEARRETVLEGRVDREKYMSKRARRKAEGEVGMTNKETQKKKNFLMISRSSSVHGKKTMKQVEKIRQARAGVKKSRMAKRK